MDEIRYWTEPSGVRISSDLLHEIIDKVFDEHPCLEWVSEYYAAGEMTREQALEAAILALFVFSSKTVIALEEAWQEADPSYLPEPPPLDQTPKDPN